jgi:hypothetical protein
MTEKQHRHFHSESAFRVLTSTMRVRKYRAIIRADPPIKEIKNGKKAHRIDPKMILSVLFIPEIWFIISDVFIVIKDNSKKSDLYLLN